MDNLLAGKSDSSLFRKVRLPGCYPAPLALQAVEIIPGSNRSQIRDLPIDDRLPAGIRDRFQLGTVIGIIPELRSPSPRNRDRLRPDSPLFQAIAETVAELDRAWEPERAQTDVRGHNFRRAFHRPHARNYFWCPPEMTQG